MAEPSSSPTPIYCKMCEMFSYSSASFSENQACRKCSLFMDQEARLSDLETRLHTKDSVVAPVASQRQLACADRPSLAAVSFSPAASKQLGSQGGWVAVRRKHSPKHRPVVHHRLLNDANRFSPLGDTPTKKPTLVIGGSVLRYEDNTRDDSKCIPGARAGKLLTIRTLPL